MKLTKKLEKEILETYHQYWNAYLNANMRIMASFMDENCQVIGSGQGEVFKNKKEAINYYTATADQVAGKSEIRNREITVQPAGNQILVTEESDFFVLLAGTWTYYSAGRISTLFAQIADQWLIIQQHGSLPDARTGGGEQINTDKIKEENIRLKDAVKRRTLELEDKNRALEIEGALQRIRSEAVAMRESSDLLDIVVTMRNEFTKLGHEAHYFWHMMWLEDKYEKAMTSGDGTRIGMVMKLPRRIHGEIKQLADWEKSDEPTIIFTMNVEATLDYVHKMGAWGDFQRIDPNMPSDDDIRHIGGLTYVMSRTTHGEIGFSLPGEVENPPAEAIEILERFAGAFDLAHQRFLDLQKTEKQTREVQIELALEKVRSRSMAMHNSDELADLSFELVKQVQALGVATWFCAFNIYDEDSKGSIEWGSNGEGVFPRYRTPREGIFLRYYDAGQKGEPLLINEIGEKECPGHYAYLCTLPGVGEQLLKMKDAGIPFPTSQIDHVAYFKYGYILFITFEPAPHSHDIFIRFAKVFEQTYTRFLDLQKAEAQARESEIQLALERVRARAMAMQKSDELSELVDTVFKELTKLDMALNWCIINVIDDPSLTNMVWAANPDIDMAPDSYHMKFEDYPFHDAMLKAYRERKAKYVYTLEGKEKKVYDKYLFSETEFRKVPEEAQAASRSMKKYVCSFVFSNFGGLQTVGEEPLSDDNLDILARFGEVFDLTYTRFNDLLKAEAQVREALIEAALERVRSRTMAMHSSDELPEAASLLFHEIQALGLPTWSAGYNILSPDKKTAECWMSSEGSIQPPFTLPFKDEKSLIEQYEFFQSDERFFVQELSDHALEQHYNYMKSVPQIGEIITELENSGIQLPTHQVNHLCKFEQGYLLFITYEPVPEAHEIFIRFTTVFDQTYTRFLDLKKAEARAREAQIEYALEKVRSRTMAMRRSDELQYTAILLFQQLDLLGIPLFGCGFNIWDEDGQFATAWMAGKDRLQLPFKTSSKADIFLRIYETSQRGESLFVEEQKGEELETHYKYMATIPVFKEVMDKMATIGVSVPSFQIMHCAFFPQGYLMFISHEDVSTTHDIFIRFAKVFEQTYTRFLDLQKAEAQAREAQIEHALERVRSRTMAMQKSAELPDAANNLFLQVQELGIPAWSAGYCIWTDDKKEATAFMSSEGVIQKPFVLPNVGVGYNFQEPLKTGETFHVGELGGDLIGEHYEFMRTLPIFGEVIDGIIEAGFPLPTFQIFHICYFKYGYVMFITYEKVPEAHQIFKRFANVFERTYTRFLDLKKAEAQAREAQIEHALEKVRSRTMAMQKSDELPEAANNLFLQVQELGIPAWSAGYCIWTEDKKGSTAFMSSEGVVQKPFVLPNVGVGYNFQEPLKTGETFHVEELGGDLIGEHYEFMRTLPIFGEVIDGIIEAGFPLPTFQIFHICYFKYGYVMFITYESVPAAHEIFKRFGKVFEQTYTRFLDLQKAEAQAREAQIEAALERTRTQSMLMQHSDELDATSKVFHEQLQLLGVDTEFSYVWLPDEAKDEHQFWVAWNSENKGSAAINSKAIIYPLDKTEPYTAACFDDWESGEPVHIHRIEPNEVTSFFSAWEELLIDAKNLTPDFYPDGLYYAEAFMKYGCFGINIKRPVTDEEKHILQRFSVEFERTYTRFLDLQKAEAQAREAQIEAALERVRSQSMGMQTTKDLSNVTTEMFNQLRQFEGDLYATGIVFCNKHKGHVEQWHSLPTGGMISPFIVPIDLDYIHKYRYDQWEKGTELFSIEIPSDFIDQHFNDIFQLPSAQVVLKEFESNKIPMPPTPSWEIDYGASFEHGYLLVSSLQTFKEAEILPRFAKVFEQTYTRFLDLQKAEAQARESQIEAALEKVRSRSLAMHKPDELQEVVAVVAEKLQELGVILDAGGVIICTYFPDNKDVIQWIAAPDFSSSGKYYIPYFDDLTFNDAWESKNNGDLFFTKEYSKVEKNPFFNYAFEHTEYKNFPDEFKQFVLQSEQIVISFAWAKNSAIMLSSHTGIVPSESDIEILKRFANVFEQAYIRFMDLQKAEERARESQIDIALERVRSRTMGMQKSDELAETSAVLFQQINELASETWSCGFCIWKENDEVELWMGADSGGLLPPMLIPYKEEPTHKDIYEASLKQEPEYHRIWNGEALKNHYAFLKTIPSVAKAIQIMEDSGLTLPNQQCYYVGFFKHGYLLLITKEPNDNLIELSKRFANVFDLTYTRFLDLQLKEKQSVELLAEKQRLETTLSDLQATQAQLIQSEKMASLGELTAGIAHEIQNPLNFVNNFSEVSNELIDEMNEEIEKGDLEEAKFIAADIKQNLDKILHHGKRADGIVKGMLQHSRSSSGEKEPTDINALADEYLRLAYHGLRAKDKSFNATLETDFDQSIGKVNVIPQDFGRVLLNLITNAFHTVKERSLQYKNVDYKPTVSVTTKQTSPFQGGLEGVQITVSDNGSGIPDAIKQKIFQPFFTTKPTGEGTGLGLSLSYDIVKAHNGELSCSSQVGVGTQFIIKLPVD